MRAGIAVLAGLYGLLLGSFYSVVGWRAPNGESVATPPSRCDACGRRLAWFELLPVLSWLFLRGRCRTCGARVSIAHPLVELGTGVFFALESLRYGRSAECFIGIFAVSVLAVLSAADFAHHRLPDAVVLPATAALFTARLLFHPLPLWSYLAGAAGGFALLYLIRVISRGGMGFGDVKLFLFIGLLTGLAGTGITLAVASFAGTAAGLPLRWSGRLRARQKIAFGPALALAAALVHLYGLSWLHLYLRMLPA